MIRSIPHHHHHTVQVTKRAHLYTCVHISKFLGGRENPPPVQVAVGGGSMASHVCTLVNALVGTRKMPPAKVKGDAQCKCK